LIGISFLAKSTESAFHLLIWDFNYLIALFLWLYQLLRAFLNCYAALIGSADVNTTPVFGPSSNCVVYLAIFYIALDILS